MKSLAGESHSYRKRLFDMLKSRRLMLGLLLLFLLGLMLRLYKLDEGLIFGYDQARDAYRARSIIENREIKILGPETDIPGVYHGVGYYYLLAIPYAFSHDPAVATGFLAIINALGIFLVYYCGTLFFKNRTVALLASGLYAVSYEIVQYSRWLSNPSLGLLTTLIAFIGLWKWISGKPKGLLIASVGIALSLHFQFFLIHLYFVPLLVFLFYRPKTPVKLIFLSLVIALFIDASFLIAEIKFNFQASRALMTFFSNQATFQNTPLAFLLSYVSRYFSRFQSVFFHTVIPLNKYAVYFFLGILGFVLFRTRKTLRKSSPVAFLLLWFFTSFPLFIFSSGALTNEFSQVSIALAIIYLVAFAFAYFMKTTPSRIITMLFFVVLLVIHIRFNLVHAQDGAYIFSVQQIMTVGLEKQIIDYTYREAKGAAFSICTLTNPLFINTTWAYLYETYGMSKYAYLPYWSGSNQDNYLGHLPRDKDKVTLRFHIYEPLIGQPSQAIEIFSRLEDYVSEKIDEKKYGEFLVQKRLLLSDEEREQVTRAFGPKEHARFFNPTTLLYRCYN